MKLNWKILVAIVIIIGTVVWTADSVRSRSYSGSNLSFDIGTGPVSVTNPSDQAIPVQLLGTGTRSFSVSSPTEGIAGSSVREGTGRETSQLFEFQLPTGVTEFTVARGSKASFVANTDTNLEATVQSSTPSEARTTLIVAAVVVLAALFYISRATRHQWINNLRRNAAAGRMVKPVPEGVA